MEQIRPIYVNKTYTNSKTNIIKGSGTKLLLGLLILSICILFILGLKFLFSKNIKMISTKAIVIGDSYPACENVIKEDTKEQIINCLVNIKYNVNNTEYKKIININDSPKKIDVGDELELEYDVDNHLQMWRL